MSVQNPDHRQCSICSQLADSHHASQKVSPDPGDTYLPEAAGRLQFLRNVVSESGSPRELRQCPECTTCYLYRAEYEFLIGFGGSEDSQELTRLSAAETAEWLKRIAPSRNSTDHRAASDPRADTPAPIPRAQTIKAAPLSTEGATEARVCAEERKEMRVSDDETISVDTSEHGFIRVHYVQLDHGIDMGGRLLLERKSVSLIIALLYACLKIYAFPGAECQCGDDAFRVYGSGPDQQTFINILNRRPDGVTHSGLSGLMMTVPATEALFEQLRELG